MQCAQSTFHGSAARQAKDLAIVTINDKNDPERTQAVAWRALSLGMLTSSKMTMPRTASMAVLAGHA